MHPLVTALQQLLQPYHLHQEEKGFHGYYLFKKKQKKLIFFVHTDNQGKVYIGVSHRGSSILHRYPLLKVSADETKKAILKRHITSIDDIKRKGIAAIIELCYKCYTEHDDYTIHPL